LREPGSFLESEGITERTLIGGQKAKGVWENVRKRRGAKPNLEHVVRGNEGCRRPLRRVAV